MVDLPPRRELRRLDERADDRSEFAELLVAEIYGLDHTGDEFEWYDAVHPRTGTKVEVKSTAVERVKGGTGRFRLWEQQHRSLVASDASATAWYVFVLFDGSGGIVDWRRCRPSTVTRFVRADGGSWSRAGHADRAGRQHKVHYSEVF